MKATVSPYCWILLFLLMGLWKTTIAQTRPGDRQAEFELLAEQLFSVQDEDLPYEDLYESLFQYFIQPLDLNRAGVEELQSLFLLTEPQIQSFFRHRERNGKLLSIYEIQAIPGWDLATIQRILPFVTVTDPGIRRNSSTLLQRIKTSGKKMFLLRYERVLETRAGYLQKNDSVPPAYAGSPDKLYSRFRLNRPHDFSFGFTMEKDQGETISWDPENRKYGADFISWHAMLFDQGRLKKVVAGDFQLQYGQSLVFGSGFSIGKGAETITTIRRSNTGLRPYTSVLESGFFRGAGATFQITKTLEATSFYSSAPRDGQVQYIEDSSGNIVSGSFSSLQISGFHRTAGEIRARGSLREQSAGGVLHYKSRNRRLQLGTTTLFTRFSQEWQRRPQLYSSFEFNGKENMTGSLFGEYTWQNIHIFSEVARSKSGGMGIVAGTMISLTPLLDFAFLGRNYDRNFHSFYSTGFGEGSRTINEKGFYWGLKFQPVKALSLNAYFDNFKFPWLRYRVDAPSSGYEYLLRANYQPKKTLLMYAQLREEVKEINSNTENTGSMPLPGRKRNYLLNLDFSPAPSFSFRSRVQWSSYEINDIHTRGYALVQDLNWQWKRLKLSGRIALFDTEDYNNRQYVYEKDVLWAFSIPAYFGTGIRNYLLAQYKISKEFTIWLRWARTLYTDREEISSGNEKISGSALNQVKAQLRWMF